MDDTSDPGDGVITELITSDINDNNNICNNGSKSETVDPTKILKKKDISTVLNRKITCIK